jgi:radical SAM protein with 4Fe4S-binding SPASM domain
MSKVIVFGVSPLPIENEKRISGPGIRTWQFVKPLLDDQHQVCLISLRDQGAYFEDKPQHGLKIKNFEYHSLCEDKFKDMGFIQNLADQFNPDCVISISSFCTSEVAAALNIPKPIWFDRGDLMAEAQLKSYNSQDDSIPGEFYKLEESVLSRADVLSTVSFPQKCAVIGRLGGAGRLNRLTLGYEFVYVIPCGIDDEMRQGKAEMLRGKLVDKNDFVVLWSGGYNNWVDVDTLFKGLETAISLNSRIKFVSTGGPIDGQDDFTYKYFLSLIQKSKYEKHFIMLGWLSHDSLPGIYLESDLGLNIDKNCYETLLGSRHRLLDWMKTGLPFLTTTPSEFTQVLYNKKLCFACNSGDAASLSAAVLKLSRNRTILKDYSRRIKGFVSANYLYGNTTQALREWVKKPGFAPDKFREDKDSKKMILNFNVENFNKISCRELEKQAICIKTRNASLELVNADLTKHITDLETKRKHINEQLANQVNDCNNLRAHNASLELVNTNLTKHITNLEAERKQLNEQLANQVNDCNNLRAHNASLELVSANLTKHIANLEAERKQLKEQIINLENNRISLEKQNEELGLINNKLMNNIDILNKQVIQLNNEQEQLRAQTRILTEKLNYIYNSRPYKIYKKLREYEKFLRDFLQMFSSTKRLILYLWQGLRSHKAEGFSLFTDISAVNQDTIFVNVKNLRHRFKTWEAESTNNDPQIYLYHDLNKPLDASRYRFIKFSLFVDKVTQGQLIWWLSDGKWQTSCSFQIKKGWHKYCFDMEAMPTQGKFLGSDIGWEGLISRVRLDPAEEKGIKMKIRDIRCVSKPQRKITFVLSKVRQKAIDGLRKQLMESNIKANYEDCKNLPLVVKSKPVLIYAEISTKCNLCCRMCGRYNYKIPSSQEGFMSREVFLELSKLFTPGTQLALFGRGESLLHPDFIYFLELANKAHVKVGFNTNGLLLTPKIARAMVENKQTHITFSCSAGTPETYCKIHGTDAWQKLWDNINILNEAKRKYASPQGDNGIRDVYPVVYLEFVSQLSNINELPALLRRAFSYQVVGLLVIDVTAHSDAMEKERMNIPENIVLADKYYKEALAVHKEMIEFTNKGFDFRLPNSYSSITKKFITDAEKKIFSEMDESAENGSGFRGGNFCIEPWRTFYVRFDGTVAPCVITGRKLGDLSKNTAEEIWNGEIYQKFRERMKGENKPYECLHCHLFPGPKRYDTKLGDSSVYEPL